MKVGDYFLETGGRYSSVRAGVASWYVADKAAGWEDLGASARDSCLFCYQPHFIPRQFTYRKKASYKVQHWAIYSLHCNIIQKIIVISVLSLLHSQQDTRNVTWLIIITNQSRKSNTRTGLIFSKKLCRSSVHSRKNVEFKLEGS